MGKRKNGSQEIIMADLKMVKKENGNQEIIILLDHKVVIDRLIITERRRNGNQEIIEIIINLEKVVLKDKLNKHLKILQ